MTFQQFLQVLAFNLLSNTIPLCILLFLTCYLILKMFAKRIDSIFEREYNLLTNKRPSREISELRDELRETSQQERFGSR